MSKKIKQMEMDTLRKTFQGVRDLVFLSATGLDCQADHQFRMALRRKKIRIQMVKNSLARRVFHELNLKLEGIWEGPTLLAWGADSIADLSKAVEEQIKKFPKLKAKTAVAEGEEVAFERALKMPTRTEAIGQVLGLLLSPGARLAGQLRGPGGKVAGQIKAISENKKKEPGPSG